MLSLSFFPTLQCNILFSARRYKLQLFACFRRKALVVFPSADVWKRRLSEHQTRDGEPIPETALLKLQRVFIFQSFRAYVETNTPWGRYSKHSSCGSSELQPARAAESSAGGAAVRGAASGAGPGAAARVPRRGSPPAAPRPQTGEEETQAPQKKALPPRQR